MKLASKLIPPEELKLIQKPQLSPESIPPLRAGRDHHPRKIVAPARLRDIAEDAVDSHELGPKGGASRAARRPRERAVDQGDAIRALSIPSRTPIGIFSRAAKACRLTPLQERVLECLALTTGLNPEPKRIAQLCRCGVGSIYDFGHHPRCQRALEMVAGAKIRLAGHSILDAQISLAQRGDRDAAMPFLRTLGWVASGSDAPSQVVNLHVQQAALVAAEERAGEIEEEFSAELARLRAARRSAPDAAPVLRVDPEGELA